MGRACGTYDGEANYKQGSGGHNWNRSLGRPKHRGKDNFKMDLTEIRFEDVSSITLARGRISDGCWNRGTEHSGFVKCGEFF